MPATMRALIFEGPERISVQDWPVPEPGAGEALIRPRYVGICGSDLHLWAGDIGGTNPPSVVGHELVGEVVVPDSTGRFKAGERVAVEPVLTCGQCVACRTGREIVCRQVKVMGVHSDGGAAPFMRVPANRLHRLPDHLSDELAALTEPVAVTVHMIRQAGVQVGDTVLVLGGGPIGYFCGKVAEAAGAGRIVISEPSPARRAFLDREGFQTVDPRTEDPGAVMRDLTDGEDADVVIEFAGHPSVADTMIDAARGHGTVLIGGVHGVKPGVNLRAISVKELRLVGSRIYTSRDVANAIGLLASDRFQVRNVITGMVGLEECVERGFQVLRHEPSEMKILIDLAR